MLNSIETPPLIQASTFRNITDLRFVFGVSYSVLHALKEWEKHKSLEVSLRRIYIQTFCSSGF